MERQCGKCKGQGGRYRENRNRPKGGLASWYTSSKEWIKCDVCNGSGVNPNYREKQCERCYRTIGYHKDAQYPPKYCQNCKGIVAQEKAAKQRERERQNAMWREKSCPGLKGQGYCGKTIKYRADWDKIPDICPDCRNKAKAQKAQREAEWKEKPCRICGTAVRYHISWDKPPQICKTCKDKGADIYRAELIPPGWHSSIGETQVEKAHGTMVFRGKGTNGADYRVSWDGYGKAHWTDQGLPKGDPNRHRDPRK